jgi:glycosyltransferase involved in cell wall biosynthesis
LKIALDATYSVGRHLSGVGVYSREILWGLRDVHREARLMFCYRPHRFLRSFASYLPRGASRHLLFENRIPRGARLFHGLNQRLPSARLPGAVSTFHDLFVLTGNYSTAEFRKRFAAQARDAATRSDLIIAVSDFTATQVHEVLGVEWSRLRVIHHGVRGPGPSSPRVKRENLILHVGAIQARKNISRLITAFERTPRGWRLVLAGSAGFGGESILDRIAASPRRNDIVVTGYVSPGTLVRLYARATIFAFPSLDEGFGMPVLEAMAWGVPVITSNRSALPEVAGDAALLVDPEDESEIAYGLNTLINEEGLRRVLIEKGRQRAAAFRWQDAVERTWAVYREIAG